MPFAAANAMVAGLVAQWKQQIQSARAEPTGMDWWRETRPIPDVTPDVGDDVLAMMSETDLRDMARELLTEVRRLSRNLPREVVAAQTAETDTTFLAHFADWRTKTHLKGKTLDQASSDIKQFAAAVSETLGSLTGSHVQKWMRPC